VAVLYTQVHFYLCPQALSKFHPAFDDVLVEILAKDKLAYLLLLNGRDRHAWSKMLLSRVQGQPRNQSSLS
jgi:predicted cupin superfamily sugar epimerase